MPNSLEVQLAVLGEQYKFIQKELEEAKAARKTQYEKMEEQSVSLANMGNRLKAVEESLTKQSPTIEEFITIKHKITGAGIFGKWAWGTLAFLIGLAFSFRVEIVKWLSKT
jgi:chromosome segregation ATPase